MKKRNLRVEILRYGFYREEEYEALLKRSRAMVFLCKHETQGIAYQQSLSCNVPLLAWERGGFWQDPTYYPHQVKFETVSSVPYWDERCGMKFKDAADFQTRLEDFLAMLETGKFAPRSFILDNLTLEKCAFNNTDTLPHGLGFCLSRIKHRQAGEILKMILSGNLSLDRYEWAQICLKEFVPQSPSKIVNDIGTGDGVMRAAVEAAGGAWYGFDLFPQSDDVRCWDLSETTPDGVSKGGMALLLDVIEHCNNPWLAMKNVAASLEDGGVVILTTPNPRWSRSRCYALAKGNPICFTQQDLDLNHHVFTPWQHILAAMLKQYGFEILRYVTLDGATRVPNFDFTLRYPVRAGFALVNMLIERRDPSACGMSYGVIARKMSGAESLRTGD